MTLPLDFSAAPPRRAAPSNLAASLVAAADYGYAFLIVMISSDAFPFLGLNSILWLLAYAYFFVRLPFIYRAFGRFVQNNLVYLAYPALCVLSVTWSDVPSDTARIAVQLVVTTLVALFLGFRFTVREIFVIMAIAFALMIAFSAMNFTGAIAYPYDERGNFVGIFLSKNALGHRSVMFLVIAIFLAFFIPRVAMPVRVGYILLIGLTAGLISVSGSATAVAMALAVAVLVVAAHALTSIRWALPLAVLLAAMAFAAVFVAIAGFQVDPTRTITGLLNRSPNLTGRTILWELGWRHYLERPILGYGAGGFWNNPMFFNEIVPLQERYGDGVSAFHNLGIELLVMLGPLGLLAHGLAGYTTLARALRADYRRDRAVQACVLVLVLSLYAMALFGPQLFSQHAIPWIALVATGAALSKAPRWNRM